MNIAIGFILVLGILILVHEWGHFIVARFFGVRVDVFSIGFGPRLFGWKRGATDWRVSAPPLGGFVRMAGGGPFWGGFRQTGAPPGPQQVVSKTPPRAAAVFLPRTAGQPPFSPFLFFRVF